MNTTQPYIILSVFTQAPAMINAGHHTEAAELMEQFGIPFTEVEGRFDGQSELGFLVPWTASRELQCLKLAADFGQESVLVIDANRYGYLIAPDGEHIAGLGRYKIVDSEPAGDYTLIVDGQWLHFPDVAE